MMFLDCPAYLDQDGAARCGLPAEVRYRFTMHSTDGPLECAMIRCPVGHWFNGPIGSLTWQHNHKHDPGRARVSPPPRHDSPAASHHGPDRAGGPAAPRYPRDPAPATPRPNGAPANYLGRPARLWITAMSPHHGGASAMKHLATASNHPGTGGPPWPP
jgi:hypothetical protein